MHLGFCLLISIGASAVVPVAKADEARAIIERAVQAQGGLDKLAQIKASRSRVKGYLHRHKEAFTGEVFTQSPDKLRMILSFKGDAFAGMGSGPHTLVVDGDRGWLRFAGMSQELDQETIQRTKKESYADRVASLVPLLKEKQFTLTLIGPSKVDGEPAVDIKVRAAGKPDVVLSFSGKTGLLLKEAHRRIDPDTNQEVLQETLIRRYRQIDSSEEDEQVLRAAKIAIDGPELLAYLRSRIPTAETRKRIEALVRQLGSANFGQRQKASAALIALGPPAAPFLQEARKLPDQEIARRAEMCLEKLAGKAELARVGAAVRLLGVRRPPGTAQALLQFYPWAPDESSAEEALAALTALVQADKEAEAAIAKAQEHADPRVRAAAAAALGRDGGAYLNRPGRRLFLPGVRLPAMVQVVRDGRPSMDYETLEFHVVNRHESTLFERPE